MKQCSRCKQYKDELQYNKSSAELDGLYRYCKTCSREYSKNLRRSELGTINKIYDQQRHKSIHRNHKQPVYTKNELTVWLYENRFKELYDTWKNSNYEKDLTPSCDRLDNSKGYSLDNIELVTWKENNKRAYSDRKCGNIKQGLKPVSQYSKSNELINNYHSICEAERQTKIVKTSISACCSGKLKTAGGYVWKYTT
jgi:hypothetical protein